MTISIVSGVIIFGLLEVIVHKICETKTERFGLITFLSMAAHDFPEGSAVLISSFKSPEVLQHRMFGIAFHNVIEG